MSRYKNALKTPRESAFYAPSIGQYMQNEGFSLVDYKGYKVWKKGVGMLTAPQYLSVQYQDNVIYIEAFLRNAILPGVYAGEMGLDGFYGAIPKELLKQRVNALEQYIYSLWNTPNNQ